MTGITLAKKRPSRTSRTWTATLTSLGLAAGLALAAPVSASAAINNYDGIICTPNGAPLSYVYTYSNTAWGTNHTQRRTSTVSARTDWLGGPVPAYHSFNAGYLNIQSARIEALAPLGWIISAGRSCT